MKKPSREDGQHALEDLKRTFTVAVNRYGDGSTDSAIALYRLALSASSAATTIKLGLSAADAAFVDEVVSKINASIAASASYLPGPGDDPN